MINFIIEKHLLLLANGDTNALKHIYDLLGQQIYNLSFSILKDHHLAEDNSQEVFLKLYYESKTYKKDSNCKAWIMSITRNNAIDLLRKRKNIIYTDFTDENGNENSELVKDNISNFETNTCNKLSLKDAMIRLDDSSREIVYLHLDVGLKFKEISEVLNSPLGTVTWKYREALQKLKELLNN